MKRLSFFSLSLIVLVGLFMFSCESEPSIDVNQDKIWVEYELFYNANEDKTTAFALFRFGNSLGTQLELSDPASVTFEGDELLFNPILARHEIELDGLVTQGTFVYTDTEANVFTNQTPTMESADWPSNLNSLTLSQSADYDLVWDGAALGENQGVSVLVGPKLFVEDDLNATSITLFANRLQDLDKPSYLTFLDRWEELDPAQTTSAGGVIRAKYRAERISAEIAD
ncbi:MAG: hypothetical protein AAF927_29080 [Bacteroidota bacterium]